ncbi:cell division transporter [alpha proteobacterium U9-1i]|nr:cell division transporter [alpha proteobacterium U9-1i]
MARNYSVDLELFERGVLARLSQVDSSYDAAPVLVGVEFEVRVGEVALITGPSAAGKTSLIHLLRLAMPVRAGRAVILGADAARIGAVERARLKRRIGYVAENPTFVEHLSAFENVAMPLKLAGAKYRDYANDVQDLVEFVGIAEAARLPAERLSNAERRRTAIARALAAKPDLILADDPTAGMSPADGRRIVRLLAEMRRIGAGIVVTSQDEGLVECAPTLHSRLERGRLMPVTLREEAEADL